MKIRFAAQLLMVIAVISYFVSIGHAASISTWTVNIEILEDGSANWNVEIIYKEDIDRADYWVRGSVSNLQTAVDGNSVSCTVSKAEIGSSITCLNTKGSAVRYEFRMPAATDKIGDLFTFSHNFPIAGLIDHFTLRISLPQGDILASKDRLLATGLSPFSPSYGKEGTDGQHIFVTWELHNPKLGETVNSEVIYESVFISSAFPYILAAVAIVISICIALLYFYKFRRQPERLLPALMPAERTVMEFVIKQRTIDQKDVVRATGFSKAKVSRLVQTLIDRQLVEAVPKGRTRELRLIQKSTNEGIRSRIFRFKTKQDVDKLSLDRSQALEIVQTSITPFIDWLDSVLERLQRQKYGYAWDGSEFVIDERFTNPIPETLVREIVKMLPSTDKRIKSYDDSSKNLVGILKRMERGIIGNSTFVSMSKKLAQNKYPELEKDIAYHLVRHIIDRDKVAKFEYAWAPLWNSNASTLMRIAETRIVRNLRPELTRATQSLMRTCTLFRRELEQLRDHLRREHHLLFRELRT